MAVITISKEFGLGRSGAKKMIEATENESREYVKYYFQRDWADPELYDIIIDMGENTVDEAVEEIAREAEKRFG